VVLERTGICADGACGTREQSRTDCSARGQWCVGGLCVTPSFSGPEVALNEAVTAGFDTWNGAAGSAWKATNLGETDEREIGIAVDEEGTPRGNVNLIVLQTSSWDHSSIALGVTTPVFEADTGEIVTADMELNGVGSKRWTTGETTEPDAYDVQNVVTHEAGHFLGLDHPPCFSDGSYLPECARATMFASSAPGERQKRDLAADDVAAIAATYPADTEPSCSAPEPGFFYARTLSQTAPVASAADCPGPEAFCGGPVASPKAPTDDCSSGGATGSWWSVAAALAALAWIRRRRGYDVA
jgi:MYXO-CTERM domain-containing protein